MKRFLISILSCFLLYSINIFSQSVIFTKQVRKPGETSDVLRTMKMDFQINMILNNEIIDTFNESIYQIEKRKETVLDSNDKNINKLQVYYEKSEETNLRNNEGAKFINSVSDKTYIIENKNGKNKISYLNNKRPNKGEMDYVLGDYENFNSSNEDKELENKTFNKGDKAPFLESIILNLFGIDVKPDNNNKIDVYFNKTRFYNNINCAEFKVNLTMVQFMDKNTQMTTEITGEILIDIDTSWGILIILNGPITITGFTKKENNIIEKKGKGFFDFVFTYDYNRYNK